MVHLPHNPQGLPPGNPTSPEHISSAHEILTSLKPVVNLTSLSQNSAVPCYKEVQREAMNHQIRV
ncbi:MAG TPA: hypothetical protein P5239_02240, partial [Victivallales bacterium]|nr:hypothetical protein [Victivallales bacterium]